MSNYTEESKKIYNEVCDKYKHHWLNTTITQAMAMEMITKALAISRVGSSLPKVCKGCGSLSTKVIDKKHLACCPDSNYIPMEDYCKNSIYPDKQF